MAATPHPSIDAPRTAKTIASLLERGDEDFVQCAYLTLLGREADDAGMAHYVAELRAGADKAQIAAQLALSAEGRQRSMDLPGLDKLVAAHRPRTLPLWHRAWRRMLRPFRGPSVEPLERAVRVIDNRLYCIEAAVAASDARAQAAHAELGQIAGQIASLVAAQGPRLVGPAVTATPPAALATRQVPPRADHILQGLHRALQRRFARSQ